MSLRRLTCTEVEELGALFLLDALEPTEAEWLRVHVAADPDAHADLVRLASAAGALALAVTPVDAPPELRERVLAAIATTPQVGRFDATATSAPSAGRGQLPFRPRPASARREAPRLAWLGLAAAAALVMAGLTGWNVILQQRASDAQARAATIARAFVESTDPSSAVARLEGTPDAPDAVGFVVFPQDGVGTIVLRGLEPAPTGRTYQAWYLAGGQPTSAGLMTVGDDGLAVLAGLQPVSGTDTVALTVEPAGGVDAPTGTPVVVGTLDQPTASIELAGLR